jgi:regulator of protease activity HflC (stomatin/prohibitin superfamily)
MSLLAIITIFAIINASTGCFVTIPSGHLGIYSYLGQIQNDTIKHATFYNCLLSHVNVVKFVPDSDHRKDIKLTSSEGIEMIVSDVEISNSINPSYLVQVSKEYTPTQYDQKLVVDPMAQYLREMAAARTVDQFQITDFGQLDDILKNHIQKLNDDLKTGITIHYVRISGIEVPKEIKEKRLKLAEEKNNKILAEEELKRTRILKEKEMYVAQQDQAIKMETAIKTNEMMLRNMEAERQKKTIENAMLIETAQANAQKIRLEAEALMSMYTIPGYTEVEKMRAISGNTKIYWGNELPDVMYGGAPVVN